MQKILGISLAILLAVLTGAWLRLRGPDIPYETLEARYAKDDSHFVDLPGGYRAHYRENGAANLPLLVLLHGFGDSFTTWDGWVDELKPNFHIIAVDFPAPEGPVNTTHSPALTSKSTPPSTSRPA